MPSERKSIQRPRASPHPTVFEQSKCAARFTCASQKPSLWLPLFDWISLSNNLAYQVLFNLVFNCLTIWLTTSIQKDKWQIQNIYYKNYNTIGFTNRLCGCPVKERKVNGTCLWHLQGLLICMSERGFFYRSHSAGHHWRSLFCW